jgi:uncharacterized protein YaaR (DUF327 family)
MDRIESLEAFQFSRPSERKKSKRAGSSKRMRFSSILEGAGKESEPYDVSEEGIRELPLEELLDEVHESGEALIEAQSLEHVKRYRQAVRSFLDQVVKVMIGVEEQTSGTGVLKRKRFTQIKIIDGKLERLVAEVLRSQHRQLELLERVNEIQGLLVDLMS